MSFFRVLQRQSSVLLPESTKNRIDQQETHSPSHPASQPVQFLRSHQPNIQFTSVTRVFFCLPSPLRSTPFVSAFKFLNLQLLQAELELPAPLAQVKRQQCQQLVITTKSNRQHIAFCHCLSVCTLYYQPSGVSATGCLTKLHFSLAAHPPARHI